MEIMKTLLIQDKKPKLTLGQISLYKLILDKIDTNNPILYEEAKNIWIENVCRNKKDGQPIIYFFVKDGKEYKNIPKMKTEDDIKCCVLMWLTHNIGLLVLKGYLKIIPAIQLDT